MRTHLFLVVMAFSALTLNSFIVPVQTRSAKNYISIRRKQVLPALPNARVHNWVISNSSSREIAVSFKLTNSKGGVLPRSMIVPPNTVEQEVFSNTGPNSQYTNRIDIEASFTKP